jgi:hypothetical protein
VRFKRLPRRALRVSARFFGNRALEPVSARAGRVR